ncbi:MAG TPA: hypothetical protein VJP77_04365, partial [Planctomycetota bacterium]|nr:hypothetical protein [Planctomycetota bacterium]
GLAGLPAWIDPLSAFGGRDLALTGYLAGDDLADSAWAVFGRIDWKGKLAASLLRHPGLLDLEAQGVSVAREGDVYRVRAPGLPWPELQLVRLRDVLLVTNDARFPAKLRELESLSGQDSLGQSAVYRDSIATAARAGDELELFLELDRFGERLGWGRGFPDPMSQDVPEALLARVFQPRLVRELAGTLGFRDGLQLDVAGGLVSDRFTSFQRVAYRQARFDHDELRNEVAKLAPADCGLVAYARTDVGGLLGEYTAVMEPALRSNLVDGVLRPVFGYAGVEELVARLDGIFGNRVAVLVRANDYQRRADDPPSDDLPTLLWAVVLWIDDADDLEELQRSIIQNQSRFGLQGREPGSPGVYTNQLQNGSVVYEYWSVAVPGTGHLASVRDGDVFVISNHYALAGAMIDTRYGRQGAGLDRRGDFNALLSTGLPSASIAIWLDPRKLGPALRSVALQAAQDGAFSDFDPVGERAQIDARLLREQFGGRAPGALAEDETARLDELAEAEMDALRAAR